MIGLFVAAIAFLFGGNELIKVTFAALLATAVVHAISYLIADRLSARLPGRRPAKLRALVAGAVMLMLGLLVAGAFYVLESRVVRSVCAAISSQSWVQPWPCSSLQDKADPQSAIDRRNNRST
ncbi:MAG: hypothetical protein R3E83_13150 [Burkholderiaceae bacterium]